MTEPNEVPDDQPNDPAADQAAYAAAAAATVDRAVSNILAQLRRTPTEAQAAQLAEVTTLASTLIAKFYEIDGGDPVHLANVELARAKVNVEDALVRVAQVVTGSVEIFPKRVHNTPRGPREY